MFKLRTDFLIKFDNIYCLLYALDLNIQVVKFDSLDCPHHFGCSFRSVSFEFPFFYVLFWFSFYSFLISKFRIDATRHV